MSKWYSIIREGATRPGCLDEITLNDLWEEDNLGVNILERLAIFKKMKALPEQVIKEIPLSKWIRPWKGKEGESCCLEITMLSEEKELIPWEKFKMKEIVKNLEELKKVKKRKNNKDHKELGKLIKKGEKLEKVKENLEM